MLNMAGVDWLIIGIAALIIGISKTGIPGIGILAIPLVAWVIPAKASTGVILPMLIVGDIFAVMYYKRHAVWPHLFRLIPWAMAGIVLGSLVMNKITDRQLRPIIGLIVLTMLILNYWRNSRQKGEITVPTQWWFAAIIGLTAGVTTMLANAAGPIMAIYLLAMQLPKNEFLGTGAWYYLLMNCFKVPFSANLGLINSQSLFLNMVNLPLIMVGALSGVRLVKIIPEKTFGLIIQVLAAAAAIKLIFEFFSHP
ncbi:MAG: sulfite exporter TauE/SafE family protein [Phycisphaerae bacterium]